MSKPRTQAEIDEWNAGARQADETWWQQPHERSIGRSYEKVRTGGHRTGSGGIESVYEQQESWK